MVSRSNSIDGRQWNVGIRRSGLTKIRCGTVVYIHCNIDLKKINIRFCSIQYGSVFVQHGDVETIDG